MKQPPDWYPLSHHNRYRKLNMVRRRWGRYHSDENIDQSGQMVNLDGTWINDIPSFYLALGKAINGLNGYIGGDLDALSDCLYGGFGVLPPLTVYLTRYEEVRKALDCRAWCRFHAESFQEAVRRGEKMEALVDWGYLGNGTPLDIERWTAKYEAALTGEPFDCDELGSYFDAILGVFERSGAKLVSN